MSGFLGWMNDRICSRLWLWPALTAALLASILFAVLLNGQATAVDGVTSDTGGRAALMILGAVLLIPAFLQKIEFKVSARVSWISGAISFCVISGFWLLLHFGLDGAAWSAYGGLQVLRAKVIFADLNTVVQALACDFCSQWEQFHGPAISIGNWITFHHINGSWVAPLGFFFLFGGCVTLIALSRISSSSGRIVLLIVSFSPAWLLLLDRANIDEIVIAILILGAWFTYKSRSLLRWSIYAGLIFVIGAVKYYPLILVLTLIPVLYIRRGFWILIGFSLATATYLTIYWESFQATVRFNSDSMAILWDFPAYGRLIVLDRLGATSQSDTGWIIGNGLLFVFVFLAIVWGYALSRTTRVKNLASPILACGGSALYLSAILVGGFGFMYKGAFLIPAIPLLSMVVRDSTRAPKFALYTGSVTLLSTVLALVIAYSGLLATLAGLLAAGIMFGYSGGSMIRHLNDRSSGSGAIEKSSAFI